jgi:hypothetical protein
MTGDLVVEDDSEEGAHVQPAVTVNGGQLPELFSKGDADHLGQ